MPANKTKTGKSIKEIAEQHPVWILAGALITGCIAGVTAAEWRRATDIEELNRYRALGASPEQLKGKFNLIKGAAPSRSVPTPTPANSTDSAADVEAAANRLKELRQKNSVRKLRDLENGLVVSELPNGVYGFVASLYISKMLELRAAGKPDWMHYDIATTSPDRESSFQLELHKLQDGSLNAIGFLSEADLHLVESPGKDGRIILYEKPWEEARAITSIPLARIESIRARPFRGSYLFECKIGASSAQQAKPHP